MEVVLFGLTNRYGDLNFLTLEFWHLQGLILMARFAHKISYRILANTHIYTCAHTALSFNIDCLEIEKYLSLAELKLLSFSVKPLGTIITYVELKIRFSFVPITNGLII